MAVQVSYPGVYIEEFAPGAPIEGVGTSTACIIGIAEHGVINEPVKLTTFDRFRELYGNQPLPGFYLWHAVKGFFDNGGRVCYVVRASNGTYATWTLNDRTAAPGLPVVQLRARQPGATALTITVADAPLLTNVAVYRPQGEVAAPGATAGDREVTLAADGAILAPNVAGRFRPGDQVRFGTSANAFTILSVGGATVRFLSALPAVAAGTVMRLANAGTGTRTVRLRPAAPLPPGQLVQGTMLTISQGAGASDTLVVESVQTEVLAEGAQGGLGPNSYRVTFRTGLDFEVDLDPAGATAPRADSHELSITITGDATASYPLLSMDSTHPRYLVGVINDDAAGPLVAGLVEPPPSTELPASLPQAGAAVNIDPGTDEDLTGLTAQNFSDAIDQLRDVDDVNILSVPDRPTAAGEVMLSVHQALIAHCELMADRFAVLDSDPGAPLFGAGSIEQQRLGVDSTRGYAALYYPWLRVPPPGPGLPLLVPPSGHVCGVMARSDNARGVHKAPANEIVAGAIGLERTMSDIDHGQLNLIGVNVIRLFQGGGRPMLFGARTTATDRNWQYVNVRRLFLFLEESIQDGIRWAVFEPNNLQLWKKLHRTITEFLTRVWRDGALFGAKPEDAFYVRIDETLNPFSEQALGRLYIEIGVRPAFPAEFIIVRIGISPGGAEVIES
jgi:phage tail sheath protein FI